MNKDRIERGMDGLRMWDIVNSVGGLTIATLFPPAAPVILAGLSGNVFSSALTEVAGAEYQRRKRS